jgi:predicted dehydrogenase
MTRRPRHGGRGELSVAQHQPIRWGILGTGSIARTFTEDLVRLDDHQVVAVGSRTTASAQAFAATFGIERAQGTYDALAADPGIDVIYIATPHSEHFAAARLCLLAGQAVLVEKPFTVTADQAEALITLATESRLFAMEAMWTRFNPLIREINNLVNAGAIGRVTAIQADFAIAPGYDPADRLWNPDLAGGAVLDLGVYPIAFGSMLLGAPDRVRAVSVRAHTGVDANTAIVARYSGGAVGSYLCGLWADSPTTATITGTEGHISLAAPFYRPEAFTIHPRGDKPSTHSIVLHGHGYTYQAEEVASCLRSGLTQSLAMPLAETLSIARTLDAVRAELADS